MNNDYYVYLHRRKDTNGVFYIGQGRLKRAFTSYKRTESWKEVCNKAGGYTVEFVRTGLSRQQSINIENEYLKNQEPNWELVNKVGARDIMEIDFEHIEEFLAYDENSPSGLIWKKKSGSHTKKDMIAGSKDKVRGYWSVRLDNVLYAAHRVIWVLHNGKIDESLVVNHIDNNRGNNKIENLELVTNAVNSRRSVLNRDPLDTGVLYTKMSTGHEYWIAYWHDLNSKRSSKSFNCKIHGHEEAKRLATDYRRDRLKELNREGAGYNV
jgi:hypothetical protein